MFISEESLIEYAKKIEGSSLKETTADYLNAKGGKGKLGQLVETAYFGYEVNSRKEADFKDLGIELKVAPLKKIKAVKSSNLYRVRKGLAAKERISITMINYNQLVNESWESATLHDKIKMLLMFYIYEKDMPVESLIFDLVDVWKPNRNDLKVIEQDWNIIRDKVINGRAHLLSEGDTNFLGAATKGSTSAQVTTQPYSLEMAKTRAFSLKPSYVNSIIEELYCRKADYELKRKKEPSKIRVEGNVYEYTLNELKQGIGLTLELLIEKYSIKRKRAAKHYLSLIANDILDEVFGDRKKRLDAFEKANIEIKTILLKPNRFPKESMSFEQIDYNEIANEEWEDSEIRGKFEQIKHLWIVFESTSNYERQSDLRLDQIVLTDVFYWNMPIEDLESDYRTLWEDTALKVSRGEFNNFMKSTDNRVGHIRPKATNKSDMQKTRFGMQEKKCFWLNSGYVANEVQRFRNENKEKTDS